MKLNIQLFAYTKKEWKDLPSKDTPILAADLNNIENQLQTNTNDINALNTNLNNIENQLQTNTNDINALNTNLNKIEDGIETNNKKLSGEEVIGNIVVDSIRTKNLLDKSTIVQGDIISNTPTLRMSSRQALWLEVGTYTFSTNMTSSYNYSLTTNAVGAPPLSSYPTYDINTNWQSSSTYTITLTSPGWFVLALKRSDNGTITSTDITNLKSFNYQLEKGSTATTYSEYQNLDKTLDNYSTSEQRIGTWIDGKPLYRKVIQTTSPSADDINTNIYTITENIENAIRLDGYIYARNPTYRGNINCFIASSDYIATWFLTNSSGYPAYIRCRQHNRDNSPMRIIMEYTKTTD